ncbi:hypothetical protein CHLRE_03g205700v5 [Chlamydomonas reinhardtii]|uniref:Uncharacterized protein n=1 Tax=Chlamydomonas reinhardtii TaxID=3055 RepID=A0A2K3DZ24_CHLRE|nr:uncharacterized protein CHLRE_03g205700v5 [Chlamydomonas reinhardtii]PNW85781.1 hypothetical protein CHLRE_03g205700v5 [Chlamydomonas reinhardtii]
MACANSLSALQARRRVGLVVDDTAIGSTSHQKAFALANISLTGQTANDEGVRLARWRARAVWHTIRGNQGEDDELGEEAAPAAAPADHSDGSDDDGSEDESTEDLEAMCVLEPVEQLADILEEHGTADNLEAMWAAIDVAEEAAKAGLFKVGRPPLDEDLFGLTGLREEVGRLHGVLQEAGRWAHHVARLRVQDVRRVHLLSTGCIDRCRYSTAGKERSSSSSSSSQDEGPQSEDKQVNSNNNTNNISSSHEREVGQDAVGVQGGVSAGGSKGEGKAAAAGAAAKGEALGSEPVVAGVARGPDGGAGGGGGSDAVAAGAVTGKPAAVAGDAAVVDEVPPPAESASATEGGRSCSPGDGGCSGDSEGQVAAAVEAADQAAGAGGEEARAVAGGSGRTTGSEAKAAEKATEADATEAEAERRAREEREAVVKATAGWCMGAIVMLLHQGLDFRDSLYGDVTGHKYLKTLQVALANVHVALRQKLMHQRQREPAAAEGEAAETELLTLQFSDAVRLVVLPLMRLLADRQIQLQLYRVINSYCRGGWTALRTTVTATTATAAAAAAAATAAGQSPAPATQHVAPPATPSALEAYARTALATDLIVSLRTVGRMVVRGPGGSHLTEEHAQELSAAGNKITALAIKHHYDRLGRMPLLHQLARAALTAELDVMRGRVSAARDAYRKAAKQAEVAAAVAAARAEAGAGVSGPAAEAAEAAVEAQARAEAELQDAETEQHLHEVLLKLCDWQDKVRQADVRAARAAGVKAAPAATTAADAAAGGRDPQAAGASSSSSGAAADGGGGDGEDDDEDDEDEDDRVWSDKVRRLLLRSRRNGAGGKGEQQADGVGGGGNTSDDTDSDDDSDDEEDDDDGVAARMLRHRESVDPLALVVEPGSFTTPAVAPGAGEALSAAGGELLNYDGTVSTFIRLAALSGAHAQGHEWWTALWKTLLLEWPCGVVPCTWGSTGLQVGRVVGPRGRREEPGDKGAAAGAAGGGAAGEGGEAGVAEAGVAAKRRENAASLVRATVTECVYGIEEGLPFVALGSYTLALLLRRLLFLQRHLRAAQVLQPTAIRAPGRHTREDPHSLPEGSEPCVVLSQIGDLPGYKCSGNPKFVRDYLHAASPATAGASAGATAGATAGGAADATASSGGALAKAGGPQGSGRQQSQQQQQQPTKHLVDVIAEQLEDECYAQLICKSCEELAGAVLAVSQLRQRRREELAKAVKAASGRGPAGQAASAALVEGLSRELGIVTFHTSAATSTIIDQWADPDAAHFDLVGAGEMAILVLLLADVDVKTRRVTVVRSAKAKEWELEMERAQELEAAARWRGARGAGGLSGVGRGQVARMGVRR